MSKSSDFVRGTLHYDNLTTPITSSREAKGFLATLQVMGKLFHLEDSSETIGNHLGGEWVPLFSPIEFEYLKVRLSDVFNHLNDPLEICHALSTTCVDNDSAL